jgi:hypothetical protein
LCHIAGANYCYRPAQLQEQPQISQEPTHKEVREIKNKTDQACNQPTIIEKEILPQDRSSLTSTQKSTQEETQEIKVVQSKPTPPKGKQSINLLLVKKIIRDYKSISIANTNNHPISTFLTLFLFSHLSLLFLACTRR